ncbi:MAG: SDR family oxidoreductase [Chitinivibrionales bacterium]
MSRKHAIIITGATKRLGLRFAQESLRQNYGVIAHYRTTKGPLSSWLQNNRQYLQNVHFVKQDLCDSPQRLIDKAFETPFQIVGLVNNAAIFTQGNMLDEDHFETILDINALIPLRLSRLFAKRIKKGWIINITDAHISSFNRSYQNYRISKKILVEFTNQLASLLAPKIRVNAIAPGAMLVSNGDSKQPLSRLKRFIPLGKTGDIRSLMHAYTYLLHNHYITGQTLYVDGGWHLVD